MRWSRRICAPRRRAKCRSPKRWRNLEEHAGKNLDLRQAVKVLGGFNHEGALDSVPFNSVWNMINAVAKSTG